MAGRIQCMGAGGRTRASSSSTNDEKAVLPTLSLRMVWLLLPQVQKFI